MSAHGGSDVPNASGQVAKAGSASASGVDTWGGARITA